jgi:hypothetical protein
MSMNDESVHIDQDTDSEDRGPIDPIREAREMVPVGPGGVDPKELAGMITYAQTMRTATYLIPKYLHNNVGDCLGIIDMARRANLSPYALARASYLDPSGNGVAYTAMAWNALAEPWLQGDLKVAYEGEGPDLVCIVSGRTKKDPSELHTWRSEPLKLLHPGYTLKKGYGDGSSGKKRITYEAGQKLRAEGKLAEDEELLPRGSQLWDRKPRQQMFYDTSRDWVRAFAPKAILGIYQREEMEEYGPDFARDVTPQTPGLGERLAESGHGREEGPNGIEREIRKSQPKPKKIRKSDPKPPWKKANQKPTDATEKPVEHDAGTGEVANSGGPGGPSNGDNSGLGGPGTYAVEGGPATVPATSEEGVTVTTPVRPAGTTKAQQGPPLPTNAKDWEIYARTWLIAETDPEAIKDRWHDEIKLRNACGVTSDVRDPVKAYMDQRIKSLTSKAG